MKKVLLGLMVIFMIGSSVKTAEAQGCWIEVGVSWDDNCPVPFLYKYEVSFQIIEICSQPYPQLRFNGFETVLPPDMTTSFCVVEELCRVDIEEKCWKVVATVRKVNASTGELICHGQTIKLLNCDELLGLDNVELGVSLN